MHNLRYNIKKNNNTQRDFKGRIHCQPADAKAVEGIINSPF